jgi:[ribosomal protein S18]-alanine N-acetyltransferase
LPSLGSLKKQIPRSSRADLRLTTTSLTMEFTLRDYSPADFETLYQIDQACYPRGIAYSRRMLRWYLSQCGSLCIVAQAKDAADPAVLGFIIAHSRSAEGYIVTIDVLEAHRRSGIGTALLQETERRLAKMGVRYVELQTATDNQAGVAFWLRHGYRNSGVTRGYYLGRIDAYEMVKELHQPERPATA